jgi:myo-inositol-1(or 4)-monophosphatase
VINVMSAAALKAARGLVRDFGEVEQLQVSVKGPGDFVSNADLKADGILRDELTRARPGYGLLFEESGAVEGNDKRHRWIVDPLDGTINFLFGIPAFVVSVACEDPSGTVVGLVLDPVRDECFAATRSGPATLNGAEIVGSDRDDLATAMVATGFGYDARVRARQATVVARVLPRARDIRRFGAAAMDLAWCACGRWDAYYERGVHAWDVGVGALIAARAGLSVRDLPATAEDPAGLVVAPTGIIDELYGLVVG